MLTRVTPPFQPPPASPMPPAVSVPRDASALLGSALLSGASLLDSPPCPLCSTPLISKKGETERFCVSCDAPVLTEESYLRNRAAGTGGAAGPSPSSLLPTSLPPAALSPAASAADADDFDDEVDYIPPPSSYSTTSSAAVTSLGSLLLKGHSMLSTLCPSCNTPQLQAPDGGTLCVSCEAVEPAPAGTTADIEVLVTTSPDGSMTASLPGTGSVPGAVAGTMTVAMASAGGVRTGKKKRTVTKEEQASKDLSSKLLQGEVFFGGPWQLEEPFFFPPFSSFLPAPREGFSTPPLFFPRNERAWRFGSS